MQLFCFVGSHEYKKFDTFDQVFDTKNFIFVEFFVKYYLPQ